MDFFSYRKTETLWNSLICFNRTRDLLAVHRSQTTIRSMGGGTIAAHNATKDCLATRVTVAVLSTIPCPLHLFHMACTILLDTDYNVFICKQ